VRIAPDSRVLLRDSNHPFTHVGIGYFLEMFAKNMARAHARREGWLIDHGKGSVSGRAVRIIQGVLPRERDKGYYCYRCVASFDSESGLPIRMEIYNWDDRLAEEYRYEDLELNEGVEEEEFEKI
ncbi:MAG: DUF1571 domain-containing protein, partial [Candidatus Aureabacteria bacterium]|nr:DUF1571 domain-containing protein [Candidatus Auribacterota bacterium]